MEDATGLPFWPLDPRPEEVRIEAIAHQLGNLCRFNGACKVFYSVAQHSVLVSYLVSKRYALAGLLHDAAEAYLGDVIRPLKRFLEVKVTGPRALHDSFGARESDCWLTIMEALADPDDYGAEIEHVDVAMLATEGRDLMPSGGRHWSLPTGGAPIAGVTIRPTVGIWGVGMLRQNCDDIRVECWPPPVAAAVFLDRYRELAQ